jgi:hypothetical protein
MIHMPPRKQSASSLKKQAEWQLSIIHTALEARPVRLEHVLNMKWGVAIFSLGGMAAWFGTYGIDWTFQASFFISLFLASAGVLFAATFIIGKQNDKFKENLISLSKGTPLAQATLERILRKGEY